MALEPLPTAMMTEQTSQEKAPFPYASFSDAAPVNDMPNHATHKPQFEPSMEGQLKPMQPLLQQQATATDVISEEKKRMDELENMLSEAQSRAAVIEQEAYDKAYAAGEKSGLVLGEKRAEQIIESMQLVLQHAEQELVNLQQQSVDTVMDITTMVIEHVMGVENLDVAQSLETSINQTLAQVLPSAESRVVLLVHPQDLTMFKKMTTLVDKVYFQTGQDIPAGTCRLMTAEQDALIDPKQSLDEALKHVREQLMPHG
ncbi:MAG: FliH/SctL family protein [Ghiorsea sp.]|nr:FliH/SctL family protein [Ghiorsea sp.]